MKRMFAPWMLALALPLLAQQPAAPPAAQADSDKPVAVINGEIVTSSQLEYIWDNLGTQMRTQYESNGGKGAFLENYLIAQVKTHPSQNSILWRVNQLVDPQNQAVIAELKLFCHFGVRC